MPRQKQDVPVRLDDASSAAMSWNMLDVNGSCVSAKSILLERCYKGISQLPVEAQEIESVWKVYNVDNTKLLDSISRHLEDVAIKCCFCVKVNTLNMKNTIDHVLLGTCIIDMHESKAYEDNLPSLLNAPHCAAFLYVNNEAERESFLHLKINNTQLWYPVTVTCPMVILKLLHKQKSSDFIRTDITLLPSFPEKYSTVQLEFSILASKMALVNVNFGQEVVQAKKCFVIMQEVIQFFFGISSPFTCLQYAKEYGSLEEVEDIEQFFKALQAIRSTQSVCTGTEQYVVTHPALLCALRPYQQESIRWMLHREQWRCSPECRLASRYALYGWLMDKSVDLTHSADQKEWQQNEPLHPLYQAITMPNGQVMYYNRHAGYLVEKQPVLKTALPGGILADEMGLGKTVELLACILCNSRTKCASRNSKMMSNDIFETFKSSLEQSEDLLSVALPKDNSELTISCVSMDCSLRRTSVFASHEETEEIRDSCDTVIMEGTKFGCSSCECNVLAENEHRLSTCISLNYIGSPCSVNKDYWDKSSCQQSESSALLYDHLYHKSHVAEITQALVLSPVDDVKTCTTLPLTGISLNSSEGMSKHVNVDLPKTNALAQTEKTKKRSRSKRTCEPAVSTVDTVTSLAKTQMKNEETQCKKSRKKVTVIDNSDKLCATDRVSVTAACICGISVVDDPALFVECCLCQAWQHAKCVNFTSLGRQYYCPHCLVSKPPIESGATLIVTPSSICQQWEDEIKKHVRPGTLQIMVYNGVHKTGFIQPDILALYDIVLTTYETLRKEIDYTDLPHTNDVQGRKFRNPKRYSTVPSPLVAIEWWRVCLDEAQLVEGVTTKTANMALKLAAVNRWCITGTPIQKGLADLYGLIMFLGVDPVCVKKWWDQLLYKPYCADNKLPLEQVMSQVMWRTSKADVVDQLGLPEQVDVNHWLTLSAVEEHFYKQQYRCCAHELQKKLQKWSDFSVKLNTIDRYSLHELLQPLTRLRQACCHPQAVRGQFLPLNKRTLTMEELLQQLIKKMRYECEDAHRQFVAAMNGLAGLHLLQDELIEAANVYREVLHFVEEHKDKVRTDELQLLHVLHNLHEVVSQKPVGLVPTLRDSLLQQQCEDLRLNYLQRAQSCIDSALENLKSVQATIRELEAEMTCGWSWWTDVIHWSSGVGLGDVLVQKVKDDLMSSQLTGMNTVAHRFQNVAGLMYMISSMMDCLVESQRASVRVMEDLCSVPSRQMIDHTVACCLRPSNNKVLNTCPFCTSIAVVEDYENKLFAFVDKGVSDTPGPSTTAANDDIFSYLNANRRQGTWAESETEKVIRCIATFAKSYKAESNLIRLGKTHTKLFEQRRREFKLLRVLWRVLRDRVSAHDELDMCVTRLQLTTEPSHMNNVATLARHEIPSRHVSLTTDKTTSLNLLRRKLGQLFYLETLLKTRSVSDAELNQDPCPVCQKQLCSKWSVLQCGHSFCLNCITLLLQRPQTFAFVACLKCPMCRHVTQTADISYVIATNKDTSVTDIKGDYSTKVEGVVRCLMEISQQDPTAKALVFSSWNDVLDILAEALTENKIKFRHFQTGSKHQQMKWEDFKTDESIKALLMPLKCAANGLNMIEATHILLVEPILNGAQEKQAVGRIHRIGQTKATYVHHFVAKYTIEEQIYHLSTRSRAQHNMSESGEWNMSIDELSSLFTSFDSIPHDEDNFY